MKKMMPLLCLVLCSYTWAQQNKKNIALHCTFPSVLHGNEQKELSVNIINFLQKETVGTVTMDLFNAAGNTSVDGWFLNIFPYQYFTAIPGKKFTARFPFTVPAGFNGKLKIVITAACSNEKDSLVRTLTVQSKEIKNE